MAEKNTKSLYLPDFIIKILDEEAVKGGGPGVVAAASILEFSTKKPKEKAEIIKRFHNKEVTISYCDVLNPDDPAKVASDLEAHAIDAEVHHGSTDKKKSG